MNKIFKINITFYLDKPKNEKTYIRVSATLYGFRIQVSTKIKIKSDSWDQNKQRVKRNYTNSFEINNTLDEFCNQLSTFCSRRHLLQNNVSKDEVRTWINNFINPECEDNTNQTDENDLKYQYQQFIEYRQNVIRNKKRTIQHHQTTLNHIINFEKTTGFKVNFKSFDTEEFYSRFRSYLTTKNIPNKNINPINNNTVGSIIRNLKTFLHFSFEKGVLKNNKFIKTLPIGRDKAKEYDSQGIALTFDELQLIRNVELTTEHLKNCRELFLIQCYTAIRYSDLARIKSSDINFIQSTFRILQYKTSDWIEVPIHPVILPIFEKFRDGLPIISNQKYNDAIKEIGRLAGINAKVTVTHLFGDDIKQSVVEKWELLSTHVGRRTLITLCLQKNMLPEEVMKISGHRNRNSFQRYVKASEQQAREKFLKVF